jgi:hypothetical protein
MKRLRVQSTPPAAAPVLPTNKASRVVARFRQLALGRKRRVYLLIFLLGVYVAAMMRAMKAAHQQVAKQRDLMPMASLFLPARKAYNKLVRSMPHEIAGLLIAKRKAFQHALPCQHTEPASPKWAFPRWGDKGIPFDSLQTFIKDMPLNATTLPWPKMYREYPELLYILDKSGLSVSVSKRRYISTLNLRYRVRPTEQAMKRAHKLLQWGCKESWPRLRKALDEEGFPFIVWNGDFRSCNKHNYKGVSVPIFTVCASVACNYSFPIPTYKTIRDATASPTTWDYRFTKFKELYPFESKIPKVIWRGSLTGALENYTSDRARIARFPVDHPSSILNIGLTGIPDRHDKKGKATIDKSYFGGLANKISPQEAFQKYMGIIDIDGNSWSSRFGKLLCYNSVILKVGPRYVDYFYKTLIPWVHFVPVRHDLSDLLEMAEFVVNPANANNITTIIYNANQWCRKQLTYSYIARDLLDIWEDYIHHLDRGDPTWTQTWSQWKSTRFLSNRSALAIRPVKKLVRF